MAVFRRIESERLYQKIVDQIRVMLDAGQLKPGDRLPSERDVAEQFGVSRAAVREAFSALGTMGLLEVRPGSGTYVKGDIVMPFAVLPALQTDETELREMMEVRCSLEAETAALAAGRATAGELATMQLTLQRMEQDLASGDLGNAADWEFHMAIAVASHNSLMIRMMHHLQDAMRRNMESIRHRLFKLPGMPEQLLKEHRAIYAAIAAKDPEQARKRMVDHILRAKANAER